MRRSKNGRRHRRLSFPTLGLELVAGFLADAVDAAAAAKRDADAGCAEAHEELREADIGSHRIDRSISAGLGWIGKMRWMSWISWTRILTRSDREPALEAWPTPALRRAPEAAYTAA